MRPQQNWISSPRLNIQLYTSPPQRNESTLLQPIIQMFPTRILSRPQRQSEGYQIRISFFQNIGYASEDEIQMSANGIQLDDLQVGI
jgi:hypothetical protein